MVKSVEGVYRDCKVELLEAAAPVRESRVIVTFRSPESSVDLALRGISPQQAADLRARLKPIEQDWQRPEMDAYDELSSGDVLLVLFPDSNLAPENHSVPRVRKLGIPHRPQLISTSTSPAFSNSSASGND